MKRIPILFGLTILLIGFFSSSSCKKETIELTKIQTDTIVIVDTLAAIEELCKIEYSFI